VPTEAEEPTESEEPTASEEPVEPEQPIEDGASYRGSKRSSYAHGEYTTAEIAEMRKKKEQEIRDLDLAWRMEKIEYARMKKEVESDTVYAEVDGTVVSLLQMEEAAISGEPMVTVSGGGSYYVQVQIGEYEREKFAPGTELKIVSWTNYDEEIIGTLESVSDTPAENAVYYGVGNPNVSVYNALISVPAAANLREGEYVEVVFEAEEPQNVLYLESMYIRTENGRSYVYKRNETGKLEKCYIQTGGVYWDTYTAVYGNLTEEDWIAFPYGKLAKEGAETYEEDNSMDYGVDF